ncbi:MAG: hypothetical protein KIS79_02520 [Burkholderiales bacterium]|nr:hypothetical protein [Burkholderiales bacterium]
MSQQINLFNLALAPRVEHVTGRRCLVAMLTAALLTGTIAFAAQYAGARAEWLAAQQQAQLAAAHAEAARLMREAGARKPDPAVLAELQSLQAMIEGRKQLTAMIERGGLGDTEGVSEYLRAFARQRMDGIELTGLSITAGGRDIVIQGRTADARLLPDYLHRLREESVLRGRTFATLAMERPRAAPNHLEFRLATADAKDAAQTADGALEGGR